MDNRGAAEPMHDKRSAKKVLYVVKPSIDISHCPELPFVEETHVNFIRKN